MNKKEEKPNSFMKEKKTLVVMKQDELRSIYQTLSIEKRQMTGEEALRIRKLMREIHNLQ